jgi:hypothetical protein
MKMKSDFPIYDQPNRRRYSKVHPPLTVTAARKRRAKLATKKIYWNLGGDDNAKEDTFLSHWISDQLMHRTAYHGTTSMDCETTRGIARSLKKAGIDNKHVRMFEAYMSKI